MDGVVVVGEHGTYPRNEYGTVKFPHFEFFEQITAVFRKSGRSVPYFNDKELSWKWEWSKQMADTSHELGFPLQSGSSLPVTWRLPSVEMPMGAPVKEALSIAYGPVGSYDFHGLETIQCMVERRRGGESGVQWLQAYRGNSFWQAHRDGVWSPALFRAALSRSLTLSPSSNFTNTFPTIEEMQALVPDPVAYHYEHTDGLKSTMILLNGLVRDFNFAATIEGQPKPFSTQMYLPNAGRPHNARQLLQPAGLRRGTDVSYRQVAVSYPAQFAHKRAGRGRRAGLWRSHRDHRGKEVTIHVNAA